MCGGGDAYCQLACGIALRGPGGRLDRDLDAQPERPRGDDVGMLPGATQRHLRPCIHGGDHYVA
eukprot:4998075-Lingulodinium_polyedra.AAC.1